MKNGKSWEEQKKEKKYCLTYWEMKLQLSRITHAFNQDFQLDKVISANKTKQQGEHVAQGVNPSLPL